MACVSPYAAWSKPSPSIPDRIELEQEYPALEDDDIRQALQFAAGKLDDQIIALGVT